jgi:hypothetical protein
MRRLRDLQERFQRYLLEADESAVEGLFDRGGGAEIAVRRGVYFDAYRLRLVEALKVDFPALMALLGDERFVSVARDYAATTRSPYYNLRWYGGGFPAHLRENAATAAEPWLYELAGFEWTLMAAFDALDRTALRFEDMSALTPEQWPGARFDIHPSVRMHDFDFEVPKLWKAHKAGEDIFGQRGSARRGRWLVWRQGLETFFRSLEPQEAVALEVVAAGGNFGEMCERLDEVCDDAALRAASLLKRWLRDGLLAKMEVGAGY